MEQIVRGLPTDRAPLPDQPLMQTVELIRLRTGLSQPSPLPDCGFQQRGGRIGVVLEQFRRPDPVIPEIKPSIERRLLPLIRIDDPGPPLFGDAEIGKPILADDPLDGLDTEPMQRGRGRCETIDLRFAQLIGGIFAPIAAVQTVIGDADPVELRRPIGARLHRTTMHGYAPSSGL